MSFDEEPEYSFVGPSEMVDLTTLFPVEPEGYVEEDPVLVVNGLAFDGSGLSYEEAEEILDASLPEGSGLFDGGWL